MNIELEKRVNREWAVPNRYIDFPKPILVKMRSTYNKNWEYTRALCPVKFCKYDGLPHGFNQHYARNHATDQWRQHAKRVIKAVTDTKERKE